MTPGCAKRRTTPRTSGRSGGALTTPSGQTGWQSDDAAVRVPAHLPSISEERKGTLPSVLGYDADTGTVHRFDPGFYDDYRSTSGSTTDPDVVSSVAELFSKGPRNIPGYNLVIPEASPDTL